jgi:hypothetical protein
MAGAAFLLLDRCVLVLWVTIPVQLTAVVKAASASWERTWTEHEMDGQHFCFLAGVYWCCG